MYFDPKLWIFTAGIRHKIYGNIGVGLTAATFGVLRLGLIGWLLSHIIRGESLNEIVWLIILIGLVIVFRGILEYSRTMIAHDTAFEVQKVLSTKLFNQIIKLGPAHFGTERTGGVITSLVDGVGQLETYFGQYLPQLFIAILTPLVIFCFAAFLDIQIAAVLLLGSLFTLLAPLFFHRYDQRNSMARSLAYKSFSSDFLDSIQGLATLKAFGQSNERIKLLTKRAHELFRSTMWVLATNSLSRGITDTGIAVSAACALSLGAYKVSSGMMELESLLILLLLGTEIFKPLRDLRSLLHKGMLGQSAAIGIFNILEAVPLINKEEKLINPEIKSSNLIEFKNVNFSYPEAETKAHSDLSFTIKKGERIGIVGPSGSGKSTILKLLLRIYDIDEGLLLLEGKSTKSLDPEEFRNYFSVVSQDTYLFHGTVEENIRFGCPDASWEQVYDAVQNANAKEFIDRLPQGYDTVIGERGIRLSGGQRQRIAIARALLRNAKILLLDEALSSVDAENEVVIQEALERLMIGKTTLILAHRLSSIISSDRILVLNHGAICEEGTHENLMNVKGIYYNLMDPQVQDSKLLSNKLREKIKLAFQPKQKLAKNNHDRANKLTSIVQTYELSWMKSFLYLISEVKPWILKFFTTLSFGIGRVIAYIGVGVFSALAVAAVKIGNPHSNYLLALAVLAPLAGILHWLESWVAHDMAFRMLTEMRINLFKKLNALAPAYLVNRQSGDLMSMATQDVELIEYFFAHTVAPAFVAVLVPTAVLIVLFQFGTILALTLLPFLLFVAISPFLLRKHIDFLGSESRKSLGELNAHAVDTIQGLAEILIFQQSTKRGGHFDKLVKNYHLNRRKFFQNLTLQSSVLDITTGLGGLAVVISGTILIQSGEIESGYLPLLTLLAMSSFLPISEIAEVSRHLADTLGATRRLYTVNSEPIPVKDGTGLIKNKNKNDLVLKNISFKYRNQNEYALKKINLEIKEGSTVALVGPSGAGKTTLAHLLMRFWDPDNGTIEFGKFPLKDYRLDDLRSKIALVAQDTFLFNDTLQANIRLANPSASRRDLETAIDKAALLDFVKQLPLGIDTKVGERGMLLSGGQRQRIAIARAFLKDAPVLILDEATSHLDSISEKSIHSSLHQLMKNRTTVIIAHRLSTIKNSDMIIVMDRGQAIETGTHENLLMKDGLYSHLIKHQLTNTSVKA